MLDFDDTSAPTEAKIAELTKMIREVVIPWLLRLSTCAKIKEALISVETSASLRPIVSQEVLDVCEVQRS